MAKKSETMLKFCAETQLGATIEFVALATRGTVTENRVGSRAATYVFDESEGEFTITVNNSRQHSAAEFGAEVIYVLCALQMLGGSSIAATGFSKRVPIFDVSTWLSAENIAPLSGDKPIDERTNLTLEDLQEIWQSLALSEQPVPTLLHDTTFAALYPYADLVAGTYESLRHKSGCEVLLHTRKNSTITAHSVDAPNPVRDLVTRWKEHLDSAFVSGVLVNSGHGIYHCDGYRGLDESRWRISKMLGEVPPQHKAQVFDWAAGVINSVDEFHNTRGGVPLSETFEYVYDHMHLTADRNLRFEIKGNLLTPLQQIRKTLSNTEDGDDSILRALAAYPDWLLAVDKQHCAWLWDIEDKQTIGVMTERNGPDNASHDYLEMRGRHLMSVLPEETQMIGFDLGTDHGVYIHGKALIHLKEIALSLDCEEALTAPPMPSAVSDITSDMGKVLEHEWTILWNNDKPVVMPYKGLHGVMLFTAVDAVNAFLSQQSDPTVLQLTRMRGSDLFQLLDTHGDFDGVYVNALSDFELYPFAPAQIHALANGTQPRPERMILRARCYDELNHFLDECGMVDNRPHSTENVGNQAVIHYTGDILPGLEPRSFRFYPVPDDTPHGEWGDGATEIVCAGRLADLLRRRLDILKEELNPLDADLKPFLQTALVWAKELKKLIDPKTNMLPRRVLRTVDGARFVREYPQIATRDFVDAALEEISTLTSVQK